MTGQLDPRDHVEPIKRVPLFQHLSEDTLRAIAERLTAVHGIAAGGALYVQQGTAQCNSAIATAGDWVNLKDLFTGDAASHAEWRTTADFAGLALSKDALDSAIGGHDGYRLLLRGIAENPHVVGEAVHKTQVRDKIIFYSHRPYERFQLPIPTTFIAEALDGGSAHYASGHTIACLFTADKATRAVLQVLKACGVRLIMMRCAGTDNVDRAACRELGLQLANIPDYGPHSVAEHALALILALARRIPQTWLRTHQGDFTTSGAMMGIELCGRTAGVIGTGKIGKIVCRVLRAMGCTVLAYDVVQDEGLQAEGCKYVDLPELLALSDLITLHAPLTEKTRHMIDAGAVQAMKDGVIIVNTSRGGLIDTGALIAGLKAKRVGAVALDVYENEASIFQHDWQDQGIPDEVLARLVTFPNVIITCHQAFFTCEAVHHIHKGVVENVKRFVETGQAVNQVN